MTPQKGRVGEHTKDIVIYENRFLEKHIGNRVAGLAWD